LKFKPKSAPAPYNFCCTFSWWADRERCTSSQFPSFSQLNEHLWALNQSERACDTKLELTQILLATCGIIFLGTPHRGSCLALLAQVLATLAQLALSNINHDLIRDIERGLETLDQIRDGFSQILDKRTLVVWSL
jgi:hypothetical protein